jgi:hypothetical protein
VHRLRDRDSAQCRRVVAGLATLLLAVASGTPGAQSVPGPGRGQDAGAPGMPQPPAGPAATSRGPAADRGCVCGPDMGPGRGLKEADLNGDGKISRAEYMQMQEVRFERLPKDRNGLVSMEDALREGGLAPGTNLPRVDRPGSPPPDGTLAPGAGSRRPGTTLPPPAASPMNPVVPDPGSRPSGSNSPESEPTPAPPAPSGAAAASSTSSPSSTPSSSSPQEDKPGK